MDGGRVEALAVLGLFDPLYVAWWRRRAHASFELGQRLYQAVLAVIFSIVGW